MKSWTRPTNIFIVIIICIISVAITITLDYSYNLENIKKISNSYYSDDAVCFNFTRSYIIFDELYKALPKDMVLYEELSLNSDIRGIVFKGIFTPSPLIQGRFFNDEDFMGDKKVAVIGNKVATTEAGGKKYIEFANEKYEVIGVIGYNIDTKLDKTILLNLNQALLTSKNQFILDGDALQKMLSFLGNEQLFGTVTVVDKPQVNILKVADTRNAHLITALFFIGIIVLNSLILILFWVEKKHNEIIVKKINGYFDREILFGLYKNFFCLINVGYIIGLIISIFNLKSMEVLKSSFVLLSAYLIVILTYTIFFCFFVKKKLKSLIGRRLGVNS